MIHFSFLLKGILIGFAIAAPVGPIGVLCLRRTLAEGRAYGLVSGLGAATADAFYGSIAAFSITSIADALTGGQFWLRLIGGVFLLYLGVRTFFVQPAEQASINNKHGLLRSYGPTLFLTLTNPLTILSFAAMFTSVGIGMVGRNYYSAASIVCGVFTGSALWWLFLSYGASLLRSRINHRELRWVNRISGIIIICFAIVAFLGLE